MQLFARLLALPVALLLFLGVALPDLDLPGLHYDEALEAATPAALLLANQPLTIIHDGALQLGGLRLPLMVQNHIGAAQVYAALPFVALLGPSTTALRSTTVLIGVLTLVGVYLFVLRIYGHTAAAVAVLWLAVFPSFVFWSRQGAFVTNLAPCFAAWAFACGAGVLNQHRTPASRQRAAVLAGLFGGLAVWAKLSALWLLTGTVGWLLLVTSLAARRSPRIWRSYQPLAIASTVGLLVGSLPLILYNLLTGFKTFTVVGSSAASTYLGTSNLDVAGNLRTRVVQFADVLSSGAHLWYLGGSFPDQLALLSVVVALGVIVVGLVVNPQQTGGWQRALFAPMLMLACVLQSCFTISALWYTHFAIAVWLPAVVVGVAAQAVKWQGLQQGWRRLLQGGTLLALGLVIGSHTWTNLRYLEALRTTGGLSFHSSAIGDVSRFLASRPEPIVALDWGLAAQVEYLTGGQKRVEEFFSFTAAPPPDYAAQLQARFGRGELYLLHAANQEAFPRRQAFLDAVAAAGLRAEAVNVSIRRDGWPLIEVWQVMR